MEKTQTNSIRVFPVYDGVAFLAEVYTVEILGNGTRMFQKDNG